MIKQESFGIYIKGETIGEIWMDLVHKIMAEKERSFDEKRARYALQNILVHSETQKYPDKVIDRHANADFLKQLLDLTFKKKKMHDFDVNPSFGPGAPSYAGRIEKGGLIDFVVERLTRFPESKKAVMVFPTWDDYKQVLDQPKNDYLPCICAIHYRLLPPEMVDTGERPTMNTFFFARSIDAYQKAYGNIVAIVKITEEVIKRLNKNLKWNINKGPLTGFITDAHIYEECWNECKKMLENYESENNQY